MIKAIVFDFDGVIVDSEPLHYRAFLKVGRELDVAFTYPEYLDRYVGFDDRDAFREMLAESKHRDHDPGDEELVARLCKEKAIAFEETVNEGVRPLPGAVELIRDVSAKIPVAIASGATQADIDLILKKLGLNQLFSIIITADNVAHSKPDPQTYSLAVAELAREYPKLAIMPSDCLAIEDTAAGIKSALGAGLKTLGLAGTHPASVLSRAHRVVDSLEGLNLDQLRLWFA